MSQQVNQQQPAATASSSSAAVRISIASFDSILQDLHSGQQSTSNVSTIRTTRSTRSRSRSSQHSHNTRRRNSHHHHRRREAVQKAYAAIVRKLKLITPTLALIPLLAILVFTAIYAQRYLPKLLELLHKSLPFPLDYFSVSLMYGPLLVFFFPRTLLSAIVGFVFDFPVGLMVDLTGLVVGLVAILLVGRYILRPRLEAALGEGDDVDEDDDDQDDDQGEDDESKPLIRRSPTTNGTRMETTSAGHPISSTLPTTVPLVGSLGTSTISTTTSSWGKYMWGRVLAMRKLENRLAGWKIVALYNLSPALPIHPVTYLISLTNVSIWEALLTTLIINIPYSCLYVGLGSAATNIADILNGDSEASWWKIPLLVIGLVSAVAVATYLVRWSDQLANEVEDELEQEDDEDGEDEEGDQGEDVEDEERGEC
ncbi:hypothetical protein HK102_012733 [Quaeritorhiza haematococci]|nr:hypothetical protein HK102_012733 [Quaeritorhiza haematococci]